MYHYLYDNFLSDKRYAKLLSELENRLTDLGIQGRVDRLHPFKSLREAVDEGIKRGAKTLVAVGNDETLKKVLDVAVGKPLIIGFIPLLGQSAFAEILGIGEGVAAADTLSARLTETLDIGRINGQYFLSSVFFEAQNVSLECEGRYKVELLRGGRVAICNIAALEKGAEPHLANPFDGLLEAVLDPAPARGFIGGRIKRSVLSLKKIVARSADPFRIFSDGRELRGQTAEIDLAKEKLRLIIGKERVFAAAAC